MVDSALAKLIGAVALVGAVPDTAMFPELEVTDVPATYMPAVRLLAASTEVPVMLIASPVYGFPSFVVPVPPVSLVCKMAAPVNVAVVLPS